MWRCLTTGMDTTNRTWLDRVRRTIERLRKEVEAQPDEIYFQLCLAGWLRELQQLEQQQEHASS
jgi:hypothetical protein